MPLILGTNSIKETGYDVANSCRFNDGSSDHLVWNSSPAGNRRKFTWSCWFKRCSVGATQVLVSSSYSSGDEGYLYLSSGGSLGWQTSGSGGNMGNLYTNMLFRDLSSWYHVVFAVDTTQSTATNRIKLYINGSQYTWDGGTTQPDQDKQIYFNVGGTYYPYIGRRHGGDYFDGYMAEIVQIDDQQLDASSFGEFDSDTPTVWKPKDLSDLTFGGNTSYYLDFQDSSSLGNDVSGNNHDFTAQNLTSIDQSTDTCTNNFATFNPLKFSYEDSAVRDPTYSEGNLVALHHEAGHKCPAFSTIAANSGKWYCEVKWLAVNGSYPVNQYTGVVNIDADVVRNWNVLGYFYRGDGTQYVVGSGSSFGATYTTNDIIGIFMDLDNSKLYFSKNGAMQNSGDPTSGSTGTGAISLAADTYYAFMTEDYNNGKTSINFGSPEFSISSGNSDPNGYGNFEYDPQGYYALNTKNLAEFG